MVWATFLSIKGAFLTCGFIIFSSHFNATHLNRRLGPMSWHKETTKSRHTLVAPGPCLAQTRPGGTQALLGSPGRSQKSSSFSGSLQVSDTNSLLGMHPEEV